MQAPPVCAGAASTPQSRAGVVTMCQQCGQTLPDLWKADKIRLLMEALALYPSQANLLTQTDYQRMGFYKRLAESGRITEQLEVQAWPNSM